MKRQPFTASRKAWGKEIERKSISLFAGPLDMMPDPKGREEMRHKSLFSLDGKGNSGSIIWWNTLALFPLVFPSASTMYSSAGICGMGIIWLLFLQWDMDRDKKRSSGWRRRMRSRGISSVSSNPLHSSTSSAAASSRTALADDIEVMSTSTEMIFFQMNGGKHLRIGERPTCMGSQAGAAYPNIQNRKSSYRFLKGRHTASFYLKCGMAGQSSPFFLSDFPNGSNLIFHLTFSFWSLVEQPFASVTSFTKDWDVVTKSTTLWLGIFCARVFHDWSSLPFDPFFRFINSSWSSSTRT